MNADQRVVNRLWPIGAAVVDLGPRDANGCDLAVGSFKTGSAYNDRPAALEQIIHPECHSMR